MRCFRLLALVVAVCLLALSAGPARSQATVPVSMLSDIHFDPFHNPRLISQLRAAPVERWASILDSTPDLVEDADRLAMEVECRVHGVDTTWPLLRAALLAARQAEPHPIFVTVSGDLLAHAFPCRFRHTAPSASAADLSAFSAKTVAFVALQMRQAFPHVPVYLAVGNNDSGCGDYRETAGSPFLRSFAATTAETLRHGSLKRGASRAEISPEGDYSIALPPPLRRGRLIVLDDVFEARQYSDCAPPAARSAAPDQVQWLRAQLAEARRRREQVWVMGHIPPGIDVYSSFYRYILRPSEMCSGTLQPFLEGQAIVDTLLDFADVIRLGLFGHTHMDEIRLLRAAPPGDSGSRLGRAAIPVKLVPSISPVFGNHPAFLVAAVDPASLILKDWQTYVSPEFSGATLPWRLSYRFSSEYHLPDLSAASAQRLGDALAADRSGKDTLSETYRKHFFPGDSGLYALGLEQIWPAYACSVREHGGAAFRQCLCPAQADK